jgi:hypothetical protein
MNMETITLLIQMVMNGFKTLALVKSTRKTQLVSNGIIMTLAISLTGTVMELTT